MKKKINFTNGRFKWIKWWKKNSDKSSIITEVNTLKNENFEYKNIIDKLNKQI